MNEAAQVFYSWQSDSPVGLNRSFIGNCLKQAARSAGLDCQQSLRVDSDSKGESGTPDIPTVILEKISSAAIFVGDVTLIGITPEGKRLPNPNVLIELGYAAHYLGWDRILLVMNTHFGSPDELPFHFKHRRFPVQYALVPAETHKAEVKADLQKRLAEYISDCLSRDHLAAERLLRMMDRDCLSLLHVYKGRDYFSDDKGNFSWAVRRLLELGVIYTHRDPSQGAYAYHWTYIGSLIKAKA